MKKNVPNHHPEIDKAVVVDHSPKPEVAVRSLHVDDGCWGEAVRLQHYRLLRNRLNHIPR